MAVKLHRCPDQWVKIKPHPCWRIEKALQDMGVDYERVPGPRRKGDREAVIAGTAPGPSLAATMAQMRQAAAAESAVTSPHRGVLCDEHEFARPGAG